MGRKKFCVIFRRNKTIFAVSICKYKGYLWDAIADKGADTPRTGCGQGVDKIG